MRRLLKIIAISIGVPILLLIGCVAVDRIPYFRAKPPRSVVDVSSCLAWLKKPKDAYRIISGGNTYYQITGPAGRFASSGLAGYTFDSRGHFIGWSIDIGDFKEPAEVFGTDAQREKISLDELKMAVGQQP